MHPSSSITSTALICMIALLAPFTGAAQTCNPESIPATTPTTQFTDHGDGSVTDTKTGLMWKRCSEGQGWDGSTCTGSTTSFNWHGALQQAQAVDDAGGFAGHDDWRLPNIKELASLVEEQCYGPGINLTVFPATSSALFWSSSPSAFDGNSAGSTFFNSGALLLWRNKNDNAQVRLVRGGQ